MAIIIDNVITVVVIIHIHTTVKGTVVITNVVVVGRDHPGTVAATWEDVVLERRRSIVGVDDVTRMRVQGR